MSREGARLGAPARQVEDAIASGAAIYLMGCPIVVLYYDARVRVTNASRAHATATGKPVPGSATENATR